MSVKCLLVNGSGSGSAGNSANLIHVFKSLAADFDFQELNLVETDELQDVLPSLKWAEAFVFVTGTYWDSWGWPLQRFMEQITKTEGSEIWMGKPAAVLVTMHSVGGKSVLSRLQGVLNTFGVLLPPMSGVVISAVGLEAIKTADFDLSNDIWRPDDLAIVAANLRYAAQQNFASGRQGFQSWDVDRKGFDKVWLEP